MAEKIRVFVKRPFEKVELTAVENGLDTFQRLVEGYIECVAFPGLEGEPVDVILNEEGKFNGCKPNIAVPEYEDIFFGTLVIAGFDGEGAHVSIDKKYIDKITAYLNSHSCVDLGGIYLAPDFGVIKKESATVKNENGIRSEEEFLNSSSALFGIYQLKIEESLRDHLFASLDTLKTEGNKVERDNYDFVYAGLLSASDTLDTIFERFNINHPGDYNGRSLSVSDIVVIRKDGVNNAYYVDSLGFSKIPDFFGMGAAAARKNSGMEM